MAYAPAVTPVEPKRATTRRSPRDGRSERSRPADPSDTARVAGLRHVSDSGSGFRRRRAGKRFVYLDVEGRPIRDRRELARIASLAIPPAWTDVWICPSPRGHIQATGRDAKGRKQYRYHPRWRAVRDETKYGRLHTFGEALPRLRRRIEEDLARPGLPREKVLASVIRLLETTLIRVGNEEYARHNESYGLTTLRDEHVEVKGSDLKLNFRGKSGKEHSVDIHDCRLAKIVTRCRDLPGQELFQYRDDGGEQHVVGSADVNAYLHKLMGEEFTAKDFRTWAGTVLAARELLRSGTPASETAAHHDVVAAIKSVAERLGNTPAICRRCYVHPAVIEAYQRGDLAAFAGSIDKNLSGLSEDEQLVLELLRA
jgi:DNA topoisomerase-1